MRTKKDSRILNFLFGLQNPVKIIPGLVLAVAITIIGIQLTEWIALLRAASLCSATQRYAQGGSDDDEES